MKGPAMRTYRVCAATALAAALLGGCSDGSEGLGNPGASTGSPSSANGNNASSNNPNGTVDNGGSPAPTGGSNTSWQRSLGECPGERGRCLANRWHGRNGQSLADRRDGWDAHRPDRRNGRNACQRR